MVFSHEVWSAALKNAWNKKSFNDVKRVQFKQVFFLHKNSRRFIVLYTNMAAVTSGVKTIYSDSECDSVLVQSRSQVPLSLRGRVKEDPGNEVGARF